MAAVGLFGGSFDPVHNGHVALVQAAIAQHALDICYVVPAYDPPHKQKVETPFADRLAMASLAFAVLPPVIVVDWEAQRGGKSYTIETVAAVRKIHPRDEVFLIVGADTAEELHTWKQPEDILRSVRVLVAPRASISPSVEFADRLEYIDMDQVPVSATHIRRAVQEGKPVDHLVPPPVLTYIRKHGLYQPLNNTSQDEGDLS